MMKHNKKRNPAFVYEALLRELSETIVSQNKEKRSIIIKIIKEFFSKEKELYKELNIYRPIYETKNVPSGLASTILKESKEQFAKLDQEKLLNEKNALINKINKQVGKAIFHTFVPNYKTLATIFQVMNKGTKIKKNIMLEQNLIKSMVVQEGSQENIQPVDNIVMNEFMKRYNKTYEGVLNENQQKLMKEYIMSFDDNGLSLKVYLGEEIKRLKETLVECKNSFSDDSILEKIDKTVDLLESYKNSKIESLMIEKVMKIYNLMEELQSDESQDK